MAPTDPPTAAGVALALACLTRYEAWPITAAAIGAAAVAIATSGQPLGAGDPAASPRLAVYPLVAILAFLVLSRATVGAWFVTGGFFVADNPDYHRPFKAAGSVWWGMRQLNGNADRRASASPGLGVLAWAIVRDRAHRALLVTLALAGCAALPMYAFYQGHPFRIRYMVVLAMSLAATSGLGRRPAAAAADPGGAPRGRRGADPDAGVMGLQPPDALVTDRRRWCSRRSGIARTASIAAIVRACLARDRRGEPILASMGSLAHLMQETSADGIHLRDYIHEGIGQIWADSLEHPARHAGWVLIEEQSEGGDVLAARRRERPDFLAGFDRVCEGGGVALYRRR